MSAAAIFWVGWSAISATGFAYFVRGVVRSRRAWAKLKPAAAPSLPSPRKRRFRIRQDGWVRHDGGPCPLPAKARALILYRNRRSDSDEAHRVPDQWWRHEDGGWDVM